MHLVVIDRLEGDVTKRAEALAGALGLTAYEARARVGVPSGGPVVVSTHAEVAAADAASQNLRRAGFHAEVVAVPARGAPDPTVTVRELVLREHEVDLAPREGGPTTIAYANLDLLVRGLALTQHETTETVKQRTFSVGRAVLTGGLSLGRETKTERTTITSESEGFLYLYERGHKTPYALREAGLSYQGLGPALQPSRSANFAYVVAELRRRASGARWDDRLLHRAAQQQLLGSTLSAASHLELAIHLVAKSRREG